MKCAICHEESVIVRELPAGIVCMKCNPFRRCPKCLGVMQCASTPNDMARIKCDKCGRIDRH